MSKILHCYRDIELVAYLGFCLGGWDMTLSSSPAFKVFTTYILIEWSSLPEENKNGNGKILFVTTQLPTNSVHSKLHARNKSYST